MQSGGPDQRGEVAIAMVNATGSRAERKMSLKVEAILRQNREIVLGARIEKSVNPQSLIDPKSSSRIIGDNTKEMGAGVNR